jgi:hypothetical protein
MKNFPDPQMKLKNQAAMIKIPDRHGSINHAILYKNRKGEFFSFLRFF